MIKKKIILFLNCKLKKKSYDSNHFFAISLDNFQNELNKLFFIKYNNKKKTLL